MSNYLTAGIDTTTSQRKHSVLLNSLLKYGYCFKLSCFMKNEKKVDVNLLEFLLVHTLHFPNPNQLIMMKECPMLTLFILLLFCHSYSLVIRRPQNLAKLLFNFDIIFIFFKLSYLIKKFLFFWKI